jgi:hypothetical protein
MPKPQAYAVENDWVLTWIGPRRKPHLPQITFSRSESVNVHVKSTFPAGDPEV